MISVTSMVYTRDEMLRMYEDDPESIIGRNFESADFEPFDVYIVNSFEAAWRLAVDEIALLREQYSDDASVCKLLEIMDREGWFYTVVNKLNVGIHLGYSSTLATLADHLKACDRTFTKWVNEAYE